MARSTIPTAAVDPVRNMLEGVAKQLILRIYGLDGPKWGTQLTEIEDVVLAVRQTLSEKMLAEALTRQAHAFETQAAAPEATAEAATEATTEAREATVQAQSEKRRRCPSCDTVLSLDGSEPRTVETRAGEAEWPEPKATCRRCRRAFFPSGQEPGHRPLGAESGAAGEDRERGDESAVVRGGERDDGDPGRSGGVGEGDRARHRTHRRETRRRA